jgi:8-oxo-dGTP diphosphatase
LEHPARLLVARRTAPEQFAGLWEFPGGKVEAGEECEAALHRELSEELGVGVMRVWQAEVTEGEPHPLEDHDELRWVALADQQAVLELPWIPADFPIVQALLDVLSSQVLHSRTR